MLLMVKDPRGIRRKSALESLAKPILGAYLKKVP